MIPRPVLPGRVDVTSLYSFIRVIMERAPLSFQSIAGIIRCAHKYQADDIVHFAGLRLLEAFEPPDLFSAYRLSEPISWDELWTMWKTSRGFPDLELLDAPEAVSLLRLISTDGMEQISWALYLCILCGLEQLLIGVERKDRAPARLSNEDHALCTQVLLTLSRECYRGVQLIFKKMLQSLPDEGSSQPQFHWSCQSADSCREAITQMALKQATEDISYTLFDLFIHIDCRRSVSEAYETNHESLCATCSERLNSCSDEVYADLLGDLPSYFSRLNLS